MQSLVESRAGGDRRFRNNIERIRGRIDDGRAGDPDLGRDIPIAAAHQVAGGTGGHGSF